MLVGGLLGSILYAIVTLITWFILDKIFPGMGGLAVLGTFAAGATSCGYFSVKALLQVKSGDNNGASLPKFPMFCLGFIGAIILFFTMSSVY